MLVRETPLHVGHLKMLLALAEMGAIVFPPVPAFYNRPTELDDVVTHTVARVLDRLGLQQGLVAEWRGTRPRLADRARG
jgi:4-hydroxy-3-polyprenylbenzoate decarboxylase